MKSILIFLSCILLLSCGTQEAISIEKVTPHTQLESGKWMILCLSPENDFRSEFELQMKQQLKFHNVHSQTSTSYLPERLNHKEAKQAQLSKFVKSLPDKGYTMLLISMLDDSEKTKLDADGYFGDFTLFHYVTNVYAINEDSSQLVWSMCLCIYDYQLPELSIKDFAQAIIGRLEVDKIIPINKMELIELYSL